MCTFDIIIYIVFAIIFALLILKIVYNLSFVKVNYEFVGGDLLRFDCHDSSEVDVHLIDDISDIFIIGAVFF